MIGRRRIGQLEQNCSQSRCFTEISAWPRPLYLEEVHRNLSVMYLHFVSAICANKGTYSISNIWDYAETESKVERLVDLYQQVGGNEYVSGPAARDYLDQTAFSAHEMLVNSRCTNGFYLYP